MKQCNLNFNSNASALPKIGEMRVKVKFLAADSYYRFNFGNASGENLMITTDTECYINNVLTTSYTNDSHLTSPNVTIKGKNVNDEVTISIVNKYLLTNSDTNGTSKISVLSIQGYQYTALKRLYAYGSVMPNIKGLASLEELYCDTSSTLTTSEVALTHLKSANVHLVGLLSDIASLTTITSINLTYSGADISGNISVLNDVSSLDRLSVVASNTNVSGSIEGLPKSLTRLSAGNCTNITGSIETMAANMVTAGRTSGTLLVECKGSSVTYNGVAVAGDKTITFDSSLPNGYSIS